MKVKTFRITIFGKVQGVGYRLFCREKAQQLNITGCVRNLDDGSVQAEIAGSKPDIDKFIEELKIGPRNAKVADIAIEPIKAKMATTSTSFEITEQ